jgi:hypothetical protein
MREQCEQGDTRDPLLKGFNDSNQCGYINAFAPHQRTIYSRQLVSNEGEGRPEIEIPRVSRLKLVSILLPKYQCVDPDILETNQSVGECG